MCSADEQRQHLYVFYLHSAGERSIRDARSLSFPWSLDASHWRPATTLINDPQRVCLTAFLHHFISQPQPLPSFLYSIASKSLLFHCRASLCSRIAPFPLVTCISSIIWSLAHSLSMPPHHFLPFSIISTSLDCRPLHCLPFYHFDSVLMHSFLWLSH